MSDKTSLSEAVQLMPGVMVSPTPLKPELTLFEASRQMPSNVLVSPTPLVQPELNESWQRLPNARIRINEGGLSKLLKSLDAKGVFYSSKPKIELLEDGIYIQIATNIGTEGESLQPFPIDIFIPVK